MAGKDSHTSSEKNGGDDMDEMLKGICLGMLYLVRWPTSIIWRRYNYQYDWHYLSKMNKVSFVGVCILGMIAQAMLVWGAVLQPLIGSGIPMNDLALHALCGTYAFLTVMRIYFWAVSTNHLPGMRL